MSTLKVNKIGKVTGLTQDTLSGQIKAWARVDMDAAVVDESFGVSSLTDHATGQQTLNFTNSFATTTYVFQGSIGRSHTSGGGTKNGTIQAMDDTTVPAVGSLRFSTVDVLNAFFDYDRASLSFLGDLA